MAKLLFKFLSSRGARLVLKNRKRLKLKFALPNTYNDPYELFIQPDGDLEDEDHYAFYERLVGDIPQLPTTCFSKIPDSPTMWAHYAENHMGACLAFDESALTNEFNYAVIGDVEYSSHPATIDSGSIGFAVGTMKARHAAWIPAYANAAAYFMKRRSWQYEKERRLIVDMREVEDHKGTLIAARKYKSLRSIILGSKAKPDLRTLCAERADQLRIPLLEFRCGRRTFQPFFHDLNDHEALVWGRVDFVESESCPDCGEPCELYDRSECPWCAITESQISNAGRGSAYFIYQRAGLSTNDVHFAGKKLVGRKATGP